MTRRRGFAARARRVRLIVMDVDGVLTDGRIGLAAHGEEFKFFHSRDGIAVALARRAGLKTAIVTGEDSVIAKARGDKLGVDAVVLGARRKGETLQALLAQFDLPRDAVAFIGDDLLDISAMQLSGLAIAPADAAAEVRALAHLVTRARGGRGVLREAVERILRVQGRWKDVVDGYIRDHGGRAGAARGDAPIGDED